MYKNKQTQKYLVHFQTLLQKKRSLTKNRKKNTKSNFFGKKKTDFLKIEIAKNKMNR